MTEQLKKYIWWIIGACALLVAGWFYMTSTAQAADLGGNCCADLEERIAELEATTARKGNRKMSVVVSGQLSEAIVWHDFEENSDWSVGSNSNAPSYLQIGGHAPINPTLKAGFVMQISVGDYQVSNGFDSYGHFNTGGTHGISTRKAFVYIKGSVGQLSLGKMSMATDGVMKATTTNTDVATTPLCLQPLIGDNGLGDTVSQLLCGDGGIADGVRYDSPVMGGVQISAFVGPGTFDSTGATDKNIYDISVKGAWSWQDWQAAAAAGYRDGFTASDDLPFIGNINLVVGDVQVYSASAEIRHVPSGGFLGAALFKTDASDWLGAGSPDISGVSLKGGIEKAWSTLGPTTLYGEWGSWDSDGLLADDPSYVGAGVVQCVAGCSFLMYLSGRVYDGGSLTGDEDLTAVMAGATARF